MISLYVNHYAAGDQKRQAEIDQCLWKNFNNPLIDRVIILAQSAPELRKDLQHPKAVWRDIDCSNKPERRPSFRDFFDCINELTTAPDEIHIIAHSDVYFDESLGMIQDLNLELVSLALTRWDMNKKGEFDPHLWDTSQDAWIFQGHIRPVGDVDIPIGAPGAEGRLTWRLRQADYKVVNPALDIKACHLHASGVHTTAAQIGPPREDVWRGSLAATRIPTGRKFKTGLIAMSLFGKKAKYLTGAVENARLVRHIYPGWTLRFYVDSSVPAPVTEELKQLKTEVYVMPDGAGMYGLFWRFLSADDPGFARWMVRDADSRLNYRERRAVDEWIESGLPFHTMRDHPAHLRPIMGCAFGGMRGALMSMEKAIAEWPTKGKYADDESMLAEVIYPLVKDSMLVHDSFAQEYSDKVRPFPTERENFRFVGERFDENQEHNNNDRNALIAESARRGSYRPRGKPYAWEEQTGQTAAQEDGRKEEKFSPQPRAAAKSTEDGKQETKKIGAPVNPDIQQKFRQALQQQQRGRFAESEAIYRQILARKPDHSGAIHQLGLLAIQTGRLEDALEFFKKAVAADPKVALYHSNMGNVLASLKQPKEALEAYREAIKLKPDYAMAFNNMGSILETQGHLGQAIEALQKAVEIKPDYAEAHGNLGNALESQGRVAAAINEYRTALKISPQFAAVHSNLIYAMHFDPDYDPKAVERESRDWDERHAQPLKKFISSHAYSQDENRRLKIGYLSPDFRQHSVGYFIENVLAAHDRAAVEVYCYSDAAVPDPTTRRMETYLEAGHWQRITALPNQQVAEMIRRDQIDILVDLTGHTARNRLMIFALKPAPVQVSYLGYPGRTGLSSIDYHFTDVYADPIDGADSAEPKDSEELVRLAPTFLCYRPTDDAPPVGPLPAQKAGHVTFGCFNNWRKINPRLIALWSRILQETPGSRLVVKSRALRDPTARRNLMELCLSGGISPDRLELKEKIPSTADHLELYNSIDIALDTFAYNGTTTTCEALWMGVPVVTLAGQTHMNRVGVSILTNVGLPELIARTPEEYVEIAVKLAGDLPKLEELRRTLRQRMQASPLMDAKRFARNIEAAYREMWSTAVNRGEKVESGK